MNKIRLEFEKKDRAIYMSHLDLMRTLMRAFNRASIRLVHSEGFNPHPIMTILLPLSLGFESECELVDVELESSLSNAELVSRLNLVLPCGIKFLRAYPPVKKARELYAAEYAIHGLSPLALAPLSEKPLVVTKRTKRGESEADISEDIFSLRVADDVVCAVLAAGNVSLNPEYLIKALEKYSPELCPEHVKIRRTKILFH